MEEARLGVKKPNKGDGREMGKNVKQGHVADQNGPPGGRCNARGGGGQKAVGGCLEMSFGRGRKEAKRRKGEEGAGVGRRADLQ